MQALWCYGECGWLNDGIVLALGCYCKCGQVSCDGGVIGLDVVLW